MSNTLDEILNSIEPIFNDDYNYAQIDKVSLEKAKAQLEKLMARERLELLRSIPWKESKKYGINNPYITKAWYLEQVSELNKIIGIEG